MRDGILAGFRQLKAERFRFARKEVVRDLNQNTGPVAGQRVCADRAPMFEVFENLERAFDDRVRLLPFEVGNEADAARVAFKRRIKKAFCRRTALVPISSSSGGR